MAEGGYEHIPEWHDDTEYPDDDNADQTTPFFPKGASTPYQANAQEEIVMKSFQKSDRPETSYAETSFGGVYYDDLTKRFDALKRDRITGLLNTTKFPTVENPLSLEEKQIEIQRVRDFIKKKVSKRRFIKTGDWFFFKKTNGYCS